MWKETAAENYKSFLAYRCPLYSYSGMTLPHANIKKGHFTNTSISAILKSRKERDKKFQISLLRGGIRMAMWAVAAVVVAHGLYNTFA